MTDKKAKEELETRTYLIEFNNNKKKKVTVPAKWRVTFGPIALQKSANGRSMPLAMRFYENKDQQRAIFTDVNNFRDMSIPIEEEHVEAQDKFGSFEVDGVKKHANFRTEVREWVNPDDADAVNKKRIESLRDSDIKLADDILDIDLT